MIKNKFYKNLFQSLSFLSIVMILVFILFVGFICSINYENNNGWILLVIAASLVVFYFIIGFYWIFQKVIINEEGIEIRLKKTIIKYVWNEITSVEETTIMKNPALRIKNINGSEIHLDKRKSIVRAIEYYSKANSNLTKIDRQ
ncbi:MAG: hypothetical protein J1F32_05845 [Erysipelotrichales bacterium]|nr:hypothetical protein [Erysipelotrichales bacterium]